MNLPEGRFVLNQEAGAGSSVPRENARGRPSAWGQPCPCTHRAHTQGSSQGGLGDWSEKGYQEQGLLLGLHKGALWTRVGRVAKRRLPQGTKPGLCRQAPSPALGRGPARPLVPTLLDLSAKSSHPQLMVLRAGLSRCQAWPAAPHRLTSQSSCLPPEALSSTRTLVTRGAGWDETPGPRQWAHLSPGTL